MSALLRNHKQIAATRGTPGERSEYRIEGVKGLVLRISAQGKRRWVVRYSLDKPDGSRQFRRHQIGDADAIGLSDATDAARRVIAAVDIDGRDLKAEAVAERNRPKSATFQDLFEGWYERHAKINLSVPALEHRRYEIHLKDTLGPKPVADLSRRLISELRDDVAKSEGPIQSDSILTLYHRIMNWAVDVGLAEFNPAHRLRKVGNSMPRERILSDDELRRLWQRLDEMDAMTGEHIARAERGRILTPLTRSAIRILILTGQRRAEVIETERAELQLTGDEPAWTIPGVRTKNGLLHRLPLAPLAAAEFRKALAAGGPKSRYIFPSTVAATDVSILPTTVTRAVERICAELGITGVGPHDMRRTLGTGLARLGVPENVRALVLNHSPRRRSITEAVYNRYAYDKEKRQAFEIWEKQVRTIVGMPPA